MTIQYDAYIREKDISNRRITVKGIRFNIYPFFYLGEVPNTTWDTLMVKVTEPVESPLNLLRMLTKYVRYCNLCVFTLPTLFPDQSTYSIYLNLFTSSLNSSPNILKTAQRHIWILPILGTVFLDPYVHLCTWLKSLNITCLYGIEALNLPTSTKYPQLTIINCVQHPYKCRRAIEHQYLGIIHQDKDALFHVMNLPIDLLNYIIKPSEKTRIVSFDTTMYTKYGSLDTFLTKFL